MREAGSIRRVGILAAAFLSGCAHLPSAGFAAATSGFADGAAQVTSTFGSEFETAASVCRQRARLDFTQHRIESTAGGEYAWGKHPLWPEWAAVHKVSDESGDTWKDHCDRIAATDKLQAHALSVIAAYGNSLRALAEVGSYDGCDVGGISSKAGSIIATVGGGSGVSKTVKDVLSGMGDPLNKMTSFLLQSRTQGELRQVITEADPLVQKLLGGLVLYTDATDDEARDLEQRQKDLLSSWELAMPAGRDPARAIQIHTYASQFDEEMLRLRRHQEAHRLALDDLAKAHARLAEAAAGTRAADVKDALKKALGLLTEVLDQVAQFK